jgi:GNAT superfamily N-acetyltransferase
VTPSDVHIRQAVAGDAAVLTRVAHAAKRHWGYPEAWIDLWVSDLTVTAAFVEAHPVYCAVRGTEVVAFYALSADGAAFELEHMWVDPAHLGAGLGAHLLRHATDVVRSLGGTSLAIASDPNAEGFYRRMGARRVGSVPSTPTGRELPLLVIEIDSTS